MAQNGYKVVQDPPKKPNNKEPDYQIEGQYADCYAPMTDKVDNARSTIQTKVDTAQADIIVVNLQDALNISPSDLESLLRANPVPGLKQVFILKDGGIAKNITF
jgi:Contact-dependent growth inhibition CdiA C-terminal domain